MSEFELASDRREEITHIIENLESFFKMSRASRQATQPDVWSLFTKHLAVLGISKNEWNALEDDRLWRIAMEGFMKSSVLTIANQWEKARLQGKL